MCAYQNKYQFFIYLHIIPISRYYHMHMWIQHTMCRWYKQVMFFTSVPVEKNCGNSLPSQYPHHYYYTCERNTQIWWYMNCGKVSWKNIANKLVSLGYFTTSATTTHINKFMLHRGNWTNATRLSCSPSVCRSCNRTRKPLPKQSSKHNLPLLQRIFTNDTRLIQLLTARLEQKV